MIGDLSRNSNAVNGAGVCVCGFIYILWLKSKMQPFAYLVKESLPNYLANLPIPNTFGGWFRLGCKNGNVINRSFCLTVICLFCS